MMKKFTFLLILILGLLTMGCQSTPQSSSPLNPSKPVTIVVWHYYNGHIKDKFDALVSQFNETIGVEQGIVVDAQSHGDVQKLADAVFDAASKTIGALPMPDIFAAYPDNAYRVHQIYPLVNLETYFTEEDLSLYYSEFLEEGRFLEDNLLRIMPIAKSSENLYLNKTYWEPFAKENGLTLDALSTWEGIVEVAKTYYEATGKGFFSIDANANYMIISALQLGSPLYTHSGQKTTFEMNEVVARKLWAYFYTPYIEGYFVKTGRFSSDDAKTGMVLAYTGSTAGAAYFPKEVTFNENDIQPIEPFTLPYPVFEGGAPYAIQQGAGLCITKSDAPHEYASAVFLKWFTEPDQNISFAVSTGYFPVQTKALSEESILPALSEAEILNPSIEATMKTSIAMFADYTLYNNKPFKGSYELRTLMETHLMNRIQSNLEWLNERLDSGEERAVIIDELTNEASFQAWYESFLIEANKIMAP